MRVIKKKVSRWFVNGVGFSNKTNAYRSITKKELRQLLFKMGFAMCMSDQKKWYSLESDDQYQYIHLANRELFPNNYDGPGFSRDKRNNWIDNRTQELMKEDEL